MIEAKAARELAIVAIDAGWDVLIRHGKDTGDNAFVNVEARLGDTHLAVTWHTRSTGTYRLFSCVLNKRDVSLKTVRAELAS